MRAATVATAGLVAVAIFPQGAIAQEQWDGFFLGIHAGAVDSFSTIRDEDGTVFDADGGTLFTNDLTGLIGIHGGYNWQHGNRVLGIEADYSWTNAGRSRGVDPDPPFSDDHTASFDMNGFGSLRGRAGVAVDNTLIYVLGGIGYVDATASGSDSFPGQFVEQSNPFAFVAGAGAEFKFRNNLSARAEFLQYFWEDQTTVCISCTGPGGGPQIFSGGLSVFRAGLTYHLGQTAEKVDYPGDNAWSGLYVGGHLGAVDTSTRVQDEDDNVLDIEGISIFTNGLDASGGVHVGYNHAIGSAILGLEADYTFTDSGFSRSYDGGDHFLSAQIDGIASLRARLGLAAGNAHAYVTGGIAYIDGEIVASDNQQGETVAFDGFTALVLGAGAEVKATEKISIRGEYLYYALDEQVTVCGTCVINYPQLADGAIHTFRIGASYHLNGSAVSAEMPAASDWSGFYAGGHAAFVDTLTGIRDEDGTIYGNHEGVTVFTSSQDSGGGIYAGYNHQWGNAVVGIEVDYTFTDSGQTRFFDGTDLFKSSQIDGFGSVRGRIGLAAGEALFYATGGVGFVDAEVSAYDSVPTEVVEYEDFTALVAGVGTEFKVWDNVAVRAEYLYFGFDEKVDTCIVCGDPAYADGEIHSFRTGITFLLN